MPNELPPDGPVTRDLSDAELERVVSGKAYDGPGGNWRPQGLDNRSQNRRSPLSRTRL
ncbi:MAG TPA: hypothetical protein VMZ71_12640 [Gemmataceae bacterium]|nr:hypothetical protein [Gemmataceae bacterium]